MFWTRNRREARRQQVLDELLALDPKERRGRLDLAVGAGDVRADEVESALRLVSRLDALRVMTVPPSGRLTAGMAPIGERVLAHAGAATALNAAETAGRTDGDDASGSAAKDESGVHTSPNRALAALASRSGRRSSRRRRRSRMTSAVPVIAEIETTPELAESWPSIEWLRP